jgi:hypothetical protein
MRHAFALLVRRERSATIGPFAPEESKPSQILQHRGDELRTAPCLVEILIAQDERALPLRGALLRDPKRPGMPRMQISGWGWCETAAVRARWEKGHPNAILPTTKPGLASALNS